jgi:protein MpaA
VADAPTFDPLTIASDFMEVGLAAGFRVEEFGALGGERLFALTRRIPGKRPRIYISSGIHGDEPAPVQALLQMIREGIFDRRANWFLCPLLNPTGLSLGTRENAARVDLNRDYRNPKTEEIRAHVGWLNRQPRFDLSLCLHEDWESRGFYLFEHNPDGRESLAQGMLLAAGQAGCPADLSDRIDGFESKEGVIAAFPEPMDWPDWPEAFLLRDQFTRFAYTVESASSFSLDARVAAQVAAVGAGLAKFLGG